MRYVSTPVSMGCSGYSIAQAISPQGDLVGVYACGASNDHSFVSWGGDPLNGLNLPNQFWSRAYDINANEQIAGTMELTGVGVRAFVYQSGQVLDLGWLPGGNWSEAFAVNSSGIVVGFSSVQAGSANHAFRWNQGIMTDLSLPIGPSNQANDINDYNEIVGWMGVSPGGSFYADAFLWDNGVVTILVRPPGATSATANAINGHSSTCGAFSFPARGTSISHPVFWPSSNEIVDLGLLPGYLRGAAIDLNDADEVVGYCQNPPPNNGRRAFIWRNGVMTALESVLDPSSPQYPVWYAYGINNYGQIAATVKPPGTSERAALLTPVPPNPGDTNCDWDANIADLLAVIAAWGPYPPPPPGPIGPRHNGPGTPDLNDDGIVNIADVLTVIQAWGS